jgi:15-cis-phytoene desaturase
MSNLRRVAVVGGGVAGLTAVQELLERGYDVQLIERRRGEIGGRARSYRRRPRRPDGNGYLDVQVPVEHGFRFFPSFYQHLDDTMARIPTTAGRTALDALVPIVEETLAVMGKPPIPVAAAAFAGEQPRLQDLLGLARFPRQLLQVGVTENDLATFTDRLWQLATSCRDRRNQEYEAVPWRSFVQSLDRSHEYYWYLASGLTRTLVAAKAGKASTKTIGTIALRLIMSMGRGKTTDRVLNGPTSEVWLDPWLSHLSTLARMHGGRFTRREGTILERMEVRDRRVVSLRTRGIDDRAQPGSGDVDAVDAVDAVILALPVQELAAMLSAQRDLRRAGGEQFERIVDLASPERGYLEPMNGLQVYLKRDIPLGRGHQIYLDSPWGLTSVSQRQFWVPDSHGRFPLPDGVGGVLSIDISSWDLPGLTTPLHLEPGRPPTRKSARQCTPLEIFHDVMAQIRAALGKDAIPEAEVLGWYLDEAVTGVGGGEPVMVNHVGSWALRPEPETGLHNLFLAGDYVRTETDLACMEGANEAARRAVNGLLRSVGDHRAVELFDPMTLEPAWLRSLQEMDSYRFQRGLPWSSLPTGDLIVRGAYAVDTAGALLLANDQPSSSSSSSSSSLAAGLDLTDAGPPPRLPRVAWDPRYAKLVEPARQSAAEAVSVAAARAVPLSRTQIEERLGVDRASANRDDAFFQRWRLHEITYKDKKFLIPFHVYDGDALVIHGQAWNYDFLESWTRPTGVYRPAHCLIDGQKVGFAELWVMRYSETVVGSYDEVVINFVVTKAHRPPYRWRTPYSSLVPMMEEANRLMTLRLLITPHRIIGAGAINYGNDLFGTDKRAARIDFDRIGTVRSFAVSEEDRQILSGRIDERESFFQDAADTVAVSRELGAIEVLKNARQYSADRESGGGLVTPDFRNQPLLRSHIVEVRAAYKFFPKIRLLGPGDLTYDRSSRSDTIAALLTAMDFRPTIATRDPHLKSILYLPNWPVPIQDPPDDVLPRRRGVAIQIT